MGFRITRPSPFHHFKTSPEAISLAVMRYVWFLCCPGCRAPILQTKLDDVGRAAIDGCLQRLGQSADYFVTDKAFARILDPAA